MLWKKKPQSKAGQEFLIDLETASAQPTPAGVRPFIKKHWKPITAAVCAAAVAVAVLIPKGGAKQTSASAQYVETSPEKRNIVNCWVSVKQFSKNDTATACQDWLRSTRLGRGSIKSHVRTVKVLGMGLFAFQERIHLWKGVTH